MSHRAYWAILCSLALLALVVPAVNAAPSLGLGNHASYNLSGFLKNSQSCSANPSQFASQACFGGLPSNQTFRVSWIDNGICLPSNNATCFFSPDFIGISTGSSVEWIHSGSLVHTVTSNATFNSGLPSFDSGVVPVGSTYTHQFSIPGTYHYYCAIHPWMKGVVDVSRPPPAQPPPTTSSLQVNFDGSVAWTVIGLSSDVANLKIDHNVAVSVSPLPGVTFTPVTEQGSFEQKITLATRVESPGTAPSLILSLLRSIPPIYSAPPIYGTRTAQVYTGSLPPTFANSTSTASVGGSMFSGIMPVLLSSNSDPVTMWWVDGPLSLGSPVQILTGSSSVTGSESLNLGTALGTRDAWLVTSQFSQSINTTTPPPSSSASSTSLALNLLWSFDKRGDLLLRNGADVMVATRSVGSEQVLTGNPCGPSGWCPTFAQVTVTRTMTAQLNLALRLTSTDLNLNKRMMTSSSTSASLLEIMASIPWLPFGATGAAAGVLGVGVWRLQHARRKTSETGTVSLPS